MRRLLVLLSGVFLVSVVFGQSRPDAKPRPSTSSLDAAIAALAKTQADAAKLRAALVAKAEAGDVTAQYTLGYFAYHSVGDEYNLTEAIKWYRSAADNGHADAQFELGWMYSNGEGVQKNDAEAVRLYKLSANQGNVTAQQLLGTYYRTSQPKNIREAKRWYQMAADRGDAFSQFQIGYIYATGDGVAKNGGLAIQWYRKAALQGLSLAQANIGALYADGDGVPRDEIEGLAWTNIAAADGDAQTLQARDSMERYLGKENSLLAQQRSREILKEIEATKAAVSQSRNQPQK